MENNKMEIKTKQNEEENVILTSHAERRERRKERWKKKENKLCNKATGAHSP